MRFVGLRGVLASGMLVATTGVVVVVSSPASATADVTGVATNAGVLASSCAGQPHRIHTTDSAPHAAVACWIDNGDKLRVCDTDPTDGVHAHAEIVSEIAPGTGIKIRSEDDGADAGCDDDAGDNGVGNGVTLILKVCAQNSSQQNTRCAQTRWVESE